MLSVQDLHKTFGDIRALDGCSFEVAPGRMLGFLGPNGAGKTTAMRSIFKLIRPDSGSVTWHGELLTSDDLLRFGYMPEQRGLYPRMRIKDQLVYFGRLHGMTKPDASVSVDRWLERFGLADRSKDVLDALSHGNQQRVQLAAALVHDPDLLILDEPFSGLDPIAVETMSQVLTEQADAGKAVVFSSHQLDLVEDICEEVAIVNEGRIVVEGNVKTLKDSSPIRHIEVDFDGDIATLVTSLADIRSIESTDSHHTIVIGADTDVGDFIATAKGAGRLRHFTYTAPSLTDLFREAVT